MTKSLSAIRKLFAPGQLVTITNHYINRPEHPCFGTRTAHIARVTGSHLWFTASGNVPWPKAADVTCDDAGVVRFYGFPTAGALFLTIETHKAVR